VVSEHWQVQVVRQPDQCIHYSHPRRIITGTFYQHATPFQPVDRPLSQMTQPVMIHAEIVNRQINAPIGQAAHYCHGGGLLLQQAALLETPSV
jgi:hypothetical protein